MKSKRKYTISSNIRYIYRILFGEVKIMPILVVLGILIGIFLPMMGTVVSTVAVACITKHSAVGTFVLSMTVVLLIQALLTIANSSINSWTEFYLSHVQSRKFLMGLVEKSLYTDYDNVEPQKQQALLNGASHAVNVYRDGVNLMYSSVPMLISSFIGLILYSTTISFMDIRILFVIIIMNVVGTLLSIRANKIVQSFNEEQFALWGRFYYLKRQTMSIDGGKDIRIYRMKPWFQNAFRKETKRNAEMGVCKIKGWAAAGITDIVFSVGRDILAYALLIVKVLHGELGLAEFTFGLGMVAGFSQWVERLQYGFASIGQGNAMLVEYRKMIDFPDRFLRKTGLKLEDIKDSYQDGSLEIRFEHVSFRYEENGAEILKDINFTIQPGEKIALVGHNGAGKTTMVKLMCGLYHPTEGRILVGGHSIEEYDLEEYHKLLATIFQDINIIPLSIASNISGKNLEDTDMELVEKCLHKSGLWESVSKLKGKENTYLMQTFAEDGIELSGGMTQKLMMARAMYKNAPILILDEPTAALDPIAESQLYEEYSEFSENKTSIFISHRLASTRFCDRIIYLEHGQVAEEGTHEELMNKNGKYAYVYSVQSQYYQEVEA